MEITDMFYVISKLKVLYFTDEGLQRGEKKELKDAPLI